MARTVRVDEGEFKFAQNISVGPHFVRADEPVDAGGMDVGPDPHELLLAALGACTSITLRMYAERKRWPLDDVHIELAYVSGDVASNGTGGARDGIEMNISLAGDLSLDQRSRLLQIANKCPVHRTLTSAIPIRSSLAQPALLENSMAKALT